MNKDKDICEKLGIKHETHDGRYGEITIVRNFSTDAGAVQLLRLMEEYPDGKLFFAKMMYSGTNIEAIDDDGTVVRSFITTPGKFRDVVWELLCGGRK